MEPSVLLGFALACVILNVVPGPGMMFIVPQFLTPQGWPMSAQILILGSVLIAIGLVMDSLVGLMSGTFSTLLLRQPAIERWLKRISGAIFSALAVRLLTDH